MSFSLSLSLSLHYMPRRHTWNVKETLIAAIRRIYGVPVSVHRPTTRSPSRPWCIKHTLWVKLKQVTFLFHKNKLKRAYLNISVLPLPVTFSCFLCHADVSFLLDPTFPPTNNACAAKGTLFYPRHLNMNLIHFLLFWQVDFFRVHCHPSNLSSTHVSDWPHLSFATHFRNPFPYTTNHLSLPSLMKKSAHSSETLVTTHQITMCHILADQSL